MRAAHSAGAVLLLAATLTLAGTPGPVASQERTTVESDSAAAGYPSPTAAMVRSFALPGWGQAAYDHYFRGGIYFAGHIGNSFMILKTLGKLKEANDVEDAEVAAAEESARAQGITDPDAIRAFVNDNEAVRGIRDLIAAREQQREDWIAFGLFWVLVNGVDAFVTGHLADFPATVGATVDRRQLMIRVAIPAR